MSELSNFTSKLNQQIAENVLKLHDVLVGTEPSFEHKKAWMGYGYKIGSNYSVVSAP